MVTAIIPNYNHARFLQRRLDSIYNQTYPHLRVILLDDASTDNSRDILDAYRRHPRTQAIVYNDTNSGSPFRQWQKGLAMVETDWVWIAESDDWCELDFLESLVPALSEPDCVLAYAQLYWANDTGQIIKHAPVESESWYESGTFVRDYVLGWNRLQNAGMLVFRLSAAKLANPAWLHMRQAGDYWLWAEIAAQGRIFGSGKSLCYITKHHQSVSAQHLHTHQALKEIADTWMQMLTVGSITQKLLQKRVEMELVGLLCIRKDLTADEFRRNWSVWSQLLESTGSKPNDLRLKLLAMKAKWFHRQRRLKSAF
jgi:hypothetical protein